MIKRRVMARRKSEEGAKENVDKEERKDEMEGGRVIRWREKTRRKVDR